MIPYVLSEKCLVRSYGSSKVCVCNKNTCDTIEPVKKGQQGHFLKYTSDASGKRFEQEAGQFVKKSDGKNKIVITPSKVFQKMLGFGGALTDTTAINVMALDKSVQDKFIR